MDNDADLGFIVSAEVAVGAEWYAGPSVSAGCWHVVSVVSGLVDSRQFGVSFSNLASPTDKVVVTRFDKSSKARDKFENHFVLNVVGNALYTRTQKLPEGRRLMREVYCRRPHKSPTTGVTRRTSSSRSWVVQMAALAPRLPDVAVIAGCSRDFFADVRQ